MLAPCNTLTSPLRLLLSSPVDDRNRESSILFFLLLLGTSAIFRLQRSHCACMINMHRKNTLYPQFCLYNYINFVTHSKIVSSSITFTRNFKRKIVFVVGNTSLYSGSWLKKWMRPCGYSKWMGLENSFFAIFAMRLPFSGGHIW